MQEVLVSNENLNKNKGAWKCIFILQFRKCLQSSEIKEMFSVVFEWRMHIQNIYFCQILKRYFLNFVCCIMYAKLN